MPFDTEDNTFLLPGPVKMHPRVTRAMSVPAVANRGSEFAKVSQEMNALLQQAYQTRAPVVTLTGSGTAGMEAAAVSLLKKSDKVVALDNGKFGNRMAKLADLYGTAVPLKAPWGQPVPLETIEKALREHKPKALFMTHNETSVGFTQPLKEIAALCGEHDVLTVVDAITSLGGIDVPVDQWGLDVVITGSQKCLGAPAGLAYVSVSEKAQSRMYKDQGYYLNLTRYISKLPEGQTPYTPSTHLYFATVEALKILVKEEGLQNRFKKVRAQAEAVRGAVAAMGLELYPAEGYASDTVTAINYPQGVDDSKFRKALKDTHNLIIAGGQDDVKGKIFRIGHMGTVSFVELAGGLAAIEHELLKAGAKIRPGAWTEAFRAKMP
ncbi:MAG TPA: alanine--glyoxylate aminotransferase family protein [Candidatus Thermoplasmatota archaeon]|nr:alanine--glyoxylate aminotransferase family protein [Candidatus Thermoplasmatota archaeon]